MKKLSLILMFIFVIITVNAYVGGDNITAFDGECNYLIVNITAQPHQNLTEYTLTPNCDELEYTSNHSSYKCDCTNNYAKIIFSPAVNSVGNFTFNIDVYKLMEKKQEIFIYSNTGTEEIVEDVNKIIPGMPDVNIVVIVRPGENYYYSKLEVKNEDVYVMPKESNVQIQDIKYSNQKLDMKVEGTGIKEINVYLGNLAPPKKILVDKQQITQYTFINSILTFSVTLGSSHSIELDWNEEKVISGGGGSRYYPSNDIYVTLDDYDKRTVAVSAGKVLKIKKKSGVVVETPINYISSDSINIGTEKLTLRLGEYIKDNGVTYGLDHINGVAYLTISEQITELDILKVIMDMIDGFYAKGSPSLIEIMDKLDSFYGGIK